MFTTWLMIWEETSACHWVLFAALAILRLICLFICLPISAGHFPIISRSFLYPSLLCSWEVYLYRLHDLGSLSLWLPGEQGQWRMPAGDRRVEGSEIPCLFSPSSILSPVLAVTEFFYYSHSSCQATMQVLGHFSLLLPFKAIRGNT